MNEVIYNRRSIRKYLDKQVSKELIAQIVEANPKSVEDYKAGKNKAMGFLVGQIMKQSKGQANPTLINKLLTEKLSRM